MFARKQALNLVGAPDVVGRGFDQLKYVERTHQPIPFRNTPCGISDLEIADAGSSELASERSWLDDGADSRLAQACQDARVHEMRQRHACLRSSSPTRASAST